MQVDSGCRLDSWSIETHAFPYGVVVVCSGWRIDVIVLWGAGLSILVCGLAAGEVGTAR